MSPLEGDLELFAEIVKKLRPDLNVVRVSVLQPVAELGTRRVEITVRVRTGMYRTRSWPCPLRETVWNELLEAARCALELCEPSPPAGKWRKFGRVLR